MRLSIVPAAACLAMAACGGPETSQANNAQANVSNDSRTAVQAVGSSEKSSGTAPGNAAVFAGPVGGADAPRIMHLRHEGMETMGKTAKSIKGQLDSGSPDLAVVRAAAAKIADLSSKANGWFPAGTGPNVGRTGAKPEIWQGSAIQKDFIAKLEVEQKAAEAFSSAAAAGDVPTIETRFSDLGRTCKACHDKYRTDMHHH
jgi:cytochrome c556